jgi:primosomal protein N' (replication factor Y)
VPFIAQVLLPLPLPPFSFLVPANMTSLSIGWRVAVPWQHGVRLGIVTDIGEALAGRGLELRELVAVMDRRPWLNREAIGTILRLAEYSFTPPGTVLATLLPTGLHDPLVHEVQAVAGAQGVALASDCWVPARSLQPRALELYRKQGLVRERVYVAQATVRNLVAVKPPDDALAGPRQTNQRRALDALLAGETAASAAELSRKVNVPEGAVRALIAKGYAAYREVPAPPAPLPSYQAAPLPPVSLDVPEGPFDLSGGSRRERLAALLPSLARDVEAGGCAQLLVPEHAQLHEAASALASSVPVLAFSGELSEAQRQRLWREAASFSGVLVTTYLGLLAPVPRLRRVVVTEAGSSSYKLLSGPRLFIPTAARMLAEAHGAVFVTADVLPTPEHIYRLPAAAQVKLPASPLRCYVSDLQVVRGWPLGAEVAQVLRQVEERRRQAVLLAPRRGFSAAFRCSECAHLYLCPHCDLPLRYHRDRHRLLCHQCGHQERVPQACPVCQGVELGPSKAAGTQWIAQEVKRLVPRLPVYRFDSDRRDDLSAPLAGESCAVVATTAIMRHPPLPKVGLVVVTLLDSFLTLSDFRAEEEALRLMLNLRELSPGRRPLVLVQTFQRDHPLLGACASGDGSEFVAALLKRRKRFGYPPYGQLVKVQVSARRAADALQAAEWLAAAVRAAGGGPPALLGPVPAAVARVRNEHRYQLFVRSEGVERLSALLAPVLGYRGRARVRIDVDPRDVYGLLD